MKRAIKKYVNIFLALSFVAFSLNILLSPQYLIMATELADFADELLPPEPFVLFDEEDPLIDISIAGENIVASSTVQAIFLFTLIGLAPTLLMMLTGFTRIIIILHFVRSALGAQQMPPNQVLIGLALFLTFFVMAPIITEVHENAITPYMAGELTQQEAIDTAMEPVRGFMLANAWESNLRLFADIVGDEEYETYDDIPLRVLIPAFILTEITIGFIFGFFIYIPFIVIDMVVASVLMAMGMMMLPPVMISLPFKILLFILVDGWNLVVRLLIQTFMFLP
ncbi:MAG: flagellar type III secretion system pore protein FliP [Defluviitaleaceae bacterium]|nr:flagellar type III secretion system pore protein FliP [Defluviitaleaceae bacterium]